MAPGWVAIPGRRVYGEAVRKNGSRWGLVAAGVAASLALVPVAAEGSKPKVKLPKAGSYSGSTAKNRSIDLYVSGKSVQLAAFSFACRGADGRTSLNGIKLVKTRKGYKFALKAHGNVSFSDEGPDENAKVDIAGRFAASGTKATGTFRVKSPRCPDTGSIHWRVKR
jgi:hypothetical protein